MTYFVGFLLIIVGIIKLHMGPGQTMIWLGVALLATETLACINNLISALRDRFRQSTAPAPSEQLTRPGPIP